MLTEKNFKMITTITLVAALIVLAVLIIKPLIIPLITGILLSYIFYPIYKWTRKKIKNENLAALLVCLGLVLIILIPIIMVFSALLSQTINIYLALQNINLIEILERVIPSFLLSTSEFSKTIMNSINSFIPQVIASLIKISTNFIVNIPALMLKLFVVLFTLFFGLRDGEKGIKYLKFLSPLNKETEKHFFKQFKEVTYSVLIGHIIIGIIQGITAGIGYFVLGVPNATFLTILTIFASIIPLIGPWLVWVPIDIYLFSIGRTGAGFILLIYSLLVVSMIDNFLRPWLVSRRTKINPAIIIIGMIGGIFAFGILGLILGPLILTYVLLVIEIYRKNRNVENPFIQEEN